MSIWKEMLTMGRGTGELSSTIEEHGDGEITVATHQDVTNILGQNKDLRNHYDGYTQDRTWQRVGQIPMLVVHMWIKRYGFNAMEVGATPRILQLLDDPEWCYLKTAEGQAKRRPLREYFRGSTASPVYLDASKEVIAHG